MKNLFILFMAVGLGANAYAQSNSNFIASYSIAMPTGNLSDYIGQTSFRGISFEWNTRIKPNVELGLESGWNVFYEKVGEKVYTEGTASVSGTQYRYTNAVPIIAGAKYHFKNDSKIKPYGGVGLGTVYVDRDTDLGMYRISTQEWQFSVRPELGIRYELGGQGTALQIGAKYYANSETDNLDGQPFVAINIGFVF